MSEFGFIGDLKRSELDYILELKHGNGLLHSYDINEVKEIIIRIIGEIHNYVHFGNDITEYHITHLNYQIDTIEKQDDILKVLSYVTIFTQGYLSFINKEYIRLKKEIKKLIEKEKNYSDLKYELKFCQNIEDMNNFLSELGYTLKTENGRIENLKMKIFDINTGQKI